MAFRTGIGGTITINGSEFPVYRWTASPIGELQRYRNSKTGTHSQFAPTFTEGGTVVAYLDWQDSLNPFGGDASPFTLKVGQQVTNLLQYIDSATGTRKRQVPTGWLIGTPMDVVVDGKILVQLIIMTDGQWAEVGQAVS